MGKIISKSGKNCEYCELVKEPRRYHAWFCETRDYSAYVTGLFSLSFSSSFSSSFRYTIDVVEKKHTSEHSIINNLHHILEVFNILYVENNIDQVRVVIENRTGKHAHGWIVMNSTESSQAYDKAFKTKNGGTGEIMNSRPNGVIIPCKYSDLVKSQSVNDFFRLNGIKLRVEKNIFNIFFSLSVNNNYIGCKDIIISF